MRVLKSGKKTICILSGNGCNCPRIELDGGLVKFRDDYCGEVRMRLKLIKKLI